MRLLEERDFPYRGYHGCASLCRLRIFAPEPHEERPYVVIATELEENKGTSITNMAEHLAWAVWEYLEKPVQGMQWIEHYRDRALIGGRPMYKESFDIVTFETGPDGRFRHPTWRPAKKEEILRLAGCPL